MDALAAHRRSVQNQPLQEYSREWNYSESECTSTTKCRATKRLDSKIPNQVHIAELQPAFGAVFKNRSFSGDLKSRAQDITMG